ncbi:MFS transporter [Streptomyces sp. SID4948]|nr:MFS transporter [Streptomyces sp. SID4948]
MTHLRTPARSSLARYLCVALPARLADEGARVALVLMAVDRENSPALGGLLVAALMVPHVAAAPLVGALADRTRRRAPLHGAALIVYGLCLAATAAAVGRVPTGVLVALMALAGSCAPLLTGGLTSLLGELVPPPYLTRSFSVDSTTYNLAGIAGPALAAAIASLAGATSAVLALSASALAAGLAVPLLRPGPASAVRRRSAPGPRRPARRRPTARQQPAAAQRDVGQQHRPGGHRGAPGHRRDRGDPAARLLGGGRPDDRLRGRRAGRVPDLRGPPLGPRASRARRPGLPAGRGPAAGGGRGLSVDGPGGGLVRRRGLDHRPAVQRAAGRP